MSTIHSDDDSKIAFDILPAILSEKRKRDLSDLTQEENYYHTLRKRSINEPVYFDDLKNYNYKININKRSNRFKKAVNGQPIVLNVELLIVTDLTVYLNFQRITGSTNSANVFSVMRHYYAHLINGVKRTTNINLKTFLIDFF